jgi:multiple sugar transport system ATP-binding protein
MLGLDPYLKRKPAAPSGGQRQRVAMGRAIVREPQAFLMDEPLSNLDAKLPVSMRAALNQLHDRLGITTVYVTHDQVEAMTLGDRVCVLRDGRLQQVDTPQKPFESPVNLFVAGFIGPPAMNFVLADLIRDNGTAVSFAGTRCRSPLPSWMASQACPVTSARRSSSASVPPTSKTPPWLIPAGAGCPSPPM